MELPEHDVLQSALCAIVMWGLADHVEGSTRWVVHATLVFHGFAAVQWLGAAVIAILYILGKLREQERE